MRGISIDILSRIFCSVVDFLPRYYVVPAYSLFRNVHPYCIYTVLPAISRYPLHMQYRPNTIVLSAPSIRFCLLGQTTPLDHEAGRERDVVW